jgi:hypothetical protein
MHVLCLCRRSTVARPAGQALIIGAGAGLAGFAFVCWQSFFSYLRGNVVICICLLHWITCLGRCCFRVHLDMGAMYVLVRTVLTLRGSDIAVG